MILKMKPRGKHWPSNIPAPILARRLLGLAFDRAQARQASVYTFPAWHRQ